MDIYKETGNVVRWGWSLALGLGETALRTTGQHQLADQLSGQRPEQRLEEAVRGARHALNQEATPLTAGLGRFELRRAVVALSEVDEKTAQDVGPRVVMLALDNLPDTEAGAQEAERITREGLERVVDIINREDGFVPSARTSPEQTASVTRL